MNFNWIYIGSGNIARSTAADIQKGDHKIVAVYSRSYNKAAAFAKANGAAVYRTAAEAFAHKGADGVYIATPHTSHVSYALEAMKAGLPVLCEKPVGVCIDDVDAMLNCAKENNVYFCEAMWTWFSDVALTVKNWVQSGRLGKIKSVKINYAFPGLMMSKSSRVRTPETAGGALLDIGIYPITYCYNLFGYPDKIECKGKIKDGIDIAETVTLTYGDMKCTLKMSLTSLKESCVIIGEKGKIVLPIFFHMASKAMLKTDGKKETFKGKTDYLTEFTRACEEIRAGKKESDYIPFKATRDCMKIMDECRRQMKLVYPFESPQH